MTEATKRRGGKQPGSGRPTNKQKGLPDAMIRYSLRLPPDLAEHADRHGGASYIRKLLRAAQIEEQIV